MKILHRKLLNLISIILILFGLYLTSLYSFLLFHSLAEVFSIVIACGVFMIAWNTRYLINNNYLLFIGISYLFVGSVDFIHTIAYKGMNIFRGFDANLPTQLWIIGRYMESISLAIAPIFFKRRLNHIITFILFFIVTSIILSTVFYWKIFPDCFIEGKGLTPFKIISEYIISLILIFSVIMLLKYRDRFDRNVLNLIIWSILVTIGSELAFTFYISVYGFSNLVGHFLKIISFYLMYKAILETGLIKPYSLILRDLKKSESRLKEAQHVASLGHWEFDLKTGIPKWSDEIFNISGLDPKQGEPTFEEHKKIIHPDDWEMFSKTVELTIKEGTPYDIEFRLIRPDKSIRWMNAKGYATKDREGNTIRLFGTAQDITERKNVENIINNERKRFAVLIDNAPFGLVMIEHSGKFLYINPKFKELFGYDLEDIPDGRTFFKKAYPDAEYRKKVIETWLEDLQQLYVGEKRPRVFTLTCKDGKEKIVNFIPVKLVTGEYLISCEDITEQKRLEQQLLTMSLTDELTGLYNRRGFITLAEQQLKIAERTKKDMLLFFVDLDKMKQINDTLGHQEGDRALINLSGILKEVFRESDIIGRIGGDEFAVLALDTTEETEGVLMRRLQNTLNAFNGFEGRTYQLSLSIGAAHYNPDETLNLDELMARADTLMYGEKRKKQNE